MASTLNFNTSIAYYFSQIKVKYKAKAIALIKLTPLKNTVNVV